MSSSGSSKITEVKAERIASDFIDERDWKTFLHEVGECCYRFGKYGGVPKANFLNRLAEVLSGSDLICGKNDSISNNEVINVLRSRMKEKGLIKYRHWANEIGTNEQELNHILAGRRKVNKDVLDYLHMKRDVNITFHRLPSVAPEDSNLWKCNWILCEGGAGLSGNGRCSFDGYWWDKTCPKFIDAVCQHGIKVSRVCVKCEGANIVIEKSTAKLIKTISGLVR